MRKPKILVLDIETAPLKVYTWSLWDENTGVNQIVEEWSILAVCAKWLGKKPMYRDTRRNPRNDVPLLRWVRQLLDEADIVVTQNGQSFDVKKINARLIVEGFPPYSPIRHIDTKIVAKRHFAFTSNRLEWMGKYVAKEPKSSHKKFPGFELWAQCLAKNNAAWEEMKKYNIQDVRATERLYLKMRPWIVGHPNVNAFSNSDVQSCPKCGSQDINRNGFVVTQTGKFVRFHCKACGGWCQGKTSVLLRETSKSLLRN